MAVRFANPTSDAAPIWFVSGEAWPEIRAGLGGPAAAFAEASGFQPKAGRIQLLPDARGGLAGVLFGVDEPGARGHDPFSAGKLATTLPAGIYRFANPESDPELAALGFLLGAYRYERFRKESPPGAELVAPEDVDAGRVERIAAAVAFGRDLINAPANTLTPEALEREAVGLAELNQAKTKVTRGAELLPAGFPLVHMVGQAAAEPPRLVDFEWGRVDAPKVTLVGKGVTFDTGGLDIKPPSGMEIMKKDMGGAATALVLARLVMEASLDIRLRVVVPIVENAISASAMRPGDIVRARNGLSVEIMNTDAEGRLILADALALADEDAPELMIDFATLTGAARVALGPDLPPFYTDDDALAGEIALFSARTRDPVWRMPLWPAYDSMLESPIADLNNAPAGGFAGSITAALFLRRFVAKAKAWAHFDVYGWSPKARAHGPMGGEIQAARALFDMLEARYGRREH